MRLATQVGSPSTWSVHQTDCTGVTNSKLVTTNHGCQMRGSPSIGNRLPIGVSAQTTVKTLSGWSGEIRGEIAVKLSLAALPLRTRPDFETSRVLCGLAQNSAHSELTPNFAAQAAANIEPHTPPSHRSLATKLVVGQVVLAQLE
ncbi:hypothetical protein ACFQHW_04480 [Lapidilactobacillus achengensis]|uniref:Uncharacterized protein n=1 Tax=Lapidilactobacillus achengensis TaxID=2486000 RepID=A0ABW1ULM3_9LACO|nr:hypothetical protein [Lapidilactobacillus achengensis]